MSPAGADDPGTDGFLRAVRLVQNRLAHHDGAGGPDAEFARLLRMELAEVNPGVLVAGLMHLVIELIGRARGEDEMSTELLASIRETFLARASD